MSTTEETRAFMQGFLASAEKGIPTDQRELDGLFERYVPARSLREHVARYMAVLPGYSISVESMVCDGDLAAIRAVAKGVHKGELMGIPPTNKEVAVPFMAFYRVQDGKVVDFWAQVDRVSLLEQIGGMPTHSLAAA